MTAGSGSRAFTEQVVTITPAPAASMAGSAARVLRTADIRSSSIVARQSSSVMDKNPPVRAGAPPTLLTRTSIRSPACPIRLAGPAGSARSASTTRTRPFRASSSRSAEDFLAPTVTRAPAAASPRTMARPIPLLPPVTTARRPARPRSIACLPEALQALLVQPGQAGVGDLAPAGVDGQGVTAVGELHQVGDGLGVPVLLEGGFGSPNAACIAWRCGA